MSTIAGLEAQALPLLRCAGQDLVAPDGTPVALRGTNLGGWLLQEGWMSPAGFAPIDSTSWMMRSEPGADWESFDRRADPQSSTAGSGGLERRFAIDLGSAQTFNHVRAAIQSAANVVSVEVEVSGDGGHYWSVASASDTSGSDALNLEISYQTARYVVLTVVVDADAAVVLRDFELSVSDEFSMRHHLAKRFGAAEAERLIGRHQSAWIQETDLDQIRDIGLNFVRVPIDWQIIMEPSGQMRPDAAAFERLDWVVAECTKRGLYVVLDLHGLPGGAAPWHSSGRAGTNQFWSNELYQDWTVAIWRRVAHRYATSSTIAAFDLINEPLVTMGDPENEGEIALKFAILDRLYTAVREVAPHHAIMIPAFPGWAQALPPWAYGWTNVVYQTHHYNFPAQYDHDAMRHFIDRELADIRHFKSEWNVPVFAGEFWFGRFDDLYAHWLHGLNELGASWASWTYKVMRHPDSVGADGVQNGANWSFFNNGPARIPDLARDSAAEIAALWDSFVTDNFHANEELVRIYSDSAREGIPQP